MNFETQLARALASYNGGDPDEIVETRDGDVSVLDYPQEWYCTPLELARETLEHLVAADPSRVSLVSAGERTGSD